MNYVNQTEPNHYMYLMNYVNQTEPNHCMYLMNYGNKTNKSLHVPHELC